MAPALGPPELIARVNRDVERSVHAHGRYDRIIPVANAELLADAIPGARLRILERAGHMYPTEQPAIDREIAAFMAAAEEAS